MIPTMWSTAAVETSEAFEYWRDMICDTFVRLSVTPQHTGRFFGAIENQVFDEVGLSVVSADVYQADRTRRLIARGQQEDFLLTGIQLEGVGQVHQDGRVAILHPGSMAFYDTTRPFTLGGEGRFRRLVVQVPKAVLGKTPTQNATAIALDGTGPSRLVSEFFVGLARVHDQDWCTPGLAPHAIGLLTFALGLAGSATTPDTEAAIRQTVLDTIARAATDPEVRAEDIAAVCHVSRRTLFRALSAEGRSLSELLRYERIRRAKALLRAQPCLQVAVVAARCGFGGPAQFHRVFREVVGTSPGTYRSRPSASSAEGDLHEDRPA